MQSCACNLSSPIEEHYMEDEMQRRLGLVSAILPHLKGWQEVADYVVGKGLTYLEVMCWPNSEDKRAFAGVTHVDPYDQDDLDAMAAHLRAHNVEFILGYYPNVMDPAIQHVTVPHLMQVIRAATSIGAPVNTFAAATNTALSTNSGSACCGFGNPSDA